MAALRLTFAYEGRRIELVSAEAVDAIAPTPPVSRRGIGGFRLELLGSGGESLFARTLIDPFGESVEFPSGDPEQPFERATVENASGTFEVMVPALEGGVEVALFEGPREEAAERFVEKGWQRLQPPLARFQLPEAGRGRDG
jgi:hypothetical protein